MEKSKAKNGVLEEIPIFKGKISKFSKEVEDFASVSKVANLDFSRETTEGPTIGINLGITKFIILIRVLQSYSKIVKYPLSHALISILCYGLG